MNKIIKRLVFILSIVFVIIVILLVKNTLFKGTSALISNSSPHLPRDKNGNIITRPLGEGVDNIFLSFFTNVGDNVNPQIGSKSSLDAYKNVITYIDKNGNVTNNKFMDTFLFVSQSGLINNSHDEIFSTFKNAYNGLQTYKDDIKDTLSHLTKDDYGLYVDDRYYLLAEINKMKVVDEYLTKFNNEHGTNIKINVFMTVVNLMDKLRQGQFGDSNNSSSVNTLKNKGWVVSDSVANESIKSYIDISMSLFNTAKFKNFNLVGFYWGIETKGVEIKVSGYNSFIYYDTTKDREYFNSYVHSKGLKTLQVPYIHPNANGSDSSLDGYLTGMDFVSVQTGYFWNGTEKPINNTSKNRLEFVDMVTYYGKDIENASNKTIKKGIGAGVEVEADYNLNGELKYCNNYKAWLNYGIKHGWDKSIKVYYFTEVFANNKTDWINHKLYNREIYDATYKYAMGTLTESDVANLCVEKTFNDNYELISVGKKYETVPFKNANGNDIYEVGNKYEEDGKKLTDGIYGKSTYSSYNEWVAFNKNINSNKYYVIVDLEKVRASLNHFAVEFSNINGSGIGKPNGNINVYISNDKENFRKIGEAVSGYYIYKTENLSYRFRYELNIENYENGRYVKFEFDKGKNTFEFVSEVEVGKAKGEKNKVQVQYNANGGMLTEPYNTNYETSGDLITYNGNTILSKFDYDGKLAPNGLLNYNNKNYVNLTKDNAFIPSEKEWYIINKDGSKTYFNQSKSSYFASTLCDASKNDCVVTVYANWVDSSLTFNNKTITKMYSDSEQIIEDAIDEASGGTGTYTYTITGGNSNNYFSLDGRDLIIAANVPANTDGYELIITATDSVSGTSKNATYLIKVNKKNTTIKLSSTSGTLTYGKNATSTVTTDGDGTLSCKTSNSTVATCSISNNTLIITSKANSEDGKTATITVTQTDGVNYAANSSGVTYEVTVNRKSLRCPSSPDDKVYNGLSQSSGVSCPTGSTVGGDISGTNASDSYNQTCTAKAGYKFSNSCNITWKIKKYMPQISLDTFGYVNYDDVASLKTTITTINNCKGIITATSENADYVKISNDSDSSFDNRVSFSNVGSNEEKTIYYKGFEIGKKTNIVVEFIPGDTNNCGSVRKKFYAIVKDGNIQSNDDGVVSFNSNDDYNVKDNTLYQIIPGMTSNELFNTVDTDGELAILDNDYNLLNESVKLRTGYVLRATFTTNIIDYKISIKGDVLGTGELSRNNARAISKHIIDKNIINGEEYLFAADYNNDNYIKMNDVIKILKDKKKQENH